MTWNERLGLHLADIRRSLRMTQEEVAERVHVNVNTIQNYERGRRRIHADLLAELAKLYGVPYAALLPATVAVDA